ncbi:MAG: Flp family type IVb pilin [Alphaproteobacteria bacterium]|nr:Flp family type IVb pilin [Alphaproteobacteria bacterium]
MPKLLRFLIDDSGVTAVEYGIIAAVMGLALVAVLPILGSAVTSSFASIASHISSGR